MATRCGAAALAAVLLTAARLAGAHPASMVCNDPRMLEGSDVMHNYVVGNQYTDKLLFSSSAATYTIGEKVSLQILANGSKYVSDDAPMGVFLAVQAFSSCTLVGDHGSFNDLSEDLDFTAGCVSGVFSKTTKKFAGKSTISWTPGAGTTGDVTITVLWSNGPGSSDPLAVKGFVRVPDAYIYRKTLTLTPTAPYGPCPPGVRPAPAPAPPVVPGSSDKCVAPKGTCPVAGVRAPVFIQRLGEDEGEATFPSGRCLPCRVDHRGACKSAMVTCPTVAGGLLEEKIWATSKACEGPATRVAYASSAHAYCPGRDHYGVASLDLERFVAKLQRDHGHDFEDEATARAAVEEYRRLLELIQRFPQTPAVPSKLVDLAWHEHILDTQRYRRDCLRLFGRYVHHNPSFGGEEEKLELKTQQDDMFTLYEQTFGEQPPMSIWPTAHTKATQKLGGEGRLPDCCSALCVKPSCHSCVGCNSVFCGTLGDEGHATANAEAPVVQRTLSPDAFGGYVPTSNPLAQDASVSPYRCSFSTGVPVGDPYKMSLEWTICDDRVHFQQSLEGISSWYSLGLAPHGVTDMGLSDYLVSMMTRNYTGVKDLYKFDAGNGYPCFDVLHECSVGNEKAGTKDVEDDSIKRENGLTTSSWARKLVTGDYKDVPIERGNATVFLARGVEDAFTYHNYHYISCKVDFFSGYVNCGPAAVQERVSGAALVV